MQFHATDDNFTTANNLDHIRRTENLHLGNNLLLEFGYAPEQLGSDRDRFIYRGTWQDRLLYDGRRLIQHSLNLAGMWNLESGRSEDLVLQYELRSFHRQTKRRSFFARFNAIYTKNLNSNRQVLLGGETGARAFDNRFQTGDRRLLLSLEERMYTTLHLFNLVRVGWAIFLDVGRAWQPGVDDGLQDDYLANFGLGLQFASSKSNVGRIVHVDLAFPLTNKSNPLVDSSQISVNIKTGL